MSVFSRRNLLISGLVAIAGGYALSRKKNIPIGFELDDAELAGARALLARHPAFDSHAHPGRTFVKGASGLSPKLKIYQALGSFERRTIADMKVGGIAASAFASVSDFPVLNLGDHGLTVRRAFKPGEAYANHLCQMENLNALVERGLVAPVKKPEDVSRAHKNGKIGAWFTAEGGDFLEGKPERVKTAFAAGIRSITLMHYRTNELGDIMTGASVNGGLTTAGKSIVKTMNGVGMVIDAAHASETTVRGILKTSRAPIMCSHTHIQDKNTPTIPRFISADLARDIAAAGGLVGLWPAGIGITTLSGLVDRAFELIDLLGPNHVCLGTDMDANYKPVMESYKKMPWLVGGLIKRGLSLEDTAKLMGGNLLRLWQDVIAQGRAI